MNTGHPGRCDVFHRDSHHGAYGQPWRYRGSSSVQFLRGGSRPSCGSGGKRGSPGTLLDKGYAREVAYLNSTLQVGCAAVVIVIVMMHSRYCTHANPHLSIQATTWKSSGFDFDLPFFMFSLVVKGLFDYTCAVYQTSQDRN